MIVKEELFLFPNIQNVKDNSIQYTNKLKI